MRNLSESNRAADNNPGAPILPVILAGGEGKRLYPIASTVRPKPFVHLPDGESLLTKTCRRIADASFFLPPLIIGQESQRFALLNHARAAGVTPCAILLEPRPCNTAMAVAAATAWAEQNHPNAVMAILPADHVIAPDALWKASIDAAAMQAGTTFSIALIAVPPTHASPEYGVMELQQANGYLKVARFVEKPADPESLMRAMGGAAAWNAGQFIAPVAVMVAALTTHAKDYMHAAQSALLQATHAFEFIELAPRAYETITPTPFDRAVLEKITPIAVPFAGEWRDMGKVADWESYTGKTAQFFIDQPVRVDRPWGYYEILSKKPGAIEKRLTLYPHCRISLQRHHLRSEHWHVIAGTADIELNGERVILQTDEKIEIRERCWHRLHNKQNNILIINEKQTGFPDENDIERIDDDYGRI